MSDFGFFSIPRSLTRNPLWIDLPIGYREVFYAILEHVCFKPQKFDDHGKIIDLEIGQVCASIREITKWCGKYGDKNIIERSIKKFILYGFMRQEVRHSKTIITITHKETYDLIKRASETESETNLRHFRDNIETQKNNVNKENKEKEYTSHEAIGPKVLKIDDFSSFSDHEKVDPSADDSEGTSDNICYVAENEELKENQKIICQSKTKEKKPRKVIRPVSEQATELLRYFNTSLVNHIPEVVHFPKIEDASHLDLLLKSYTPTEIQSVIDFSHQDNFWRAHVHAPSYLKIKFAKLLASSRRSNPLVSDRGGESFEDNKKFAETIERNYSSKTCRIDVTYKAIEFVPLGGMRLPEIVPFTESAFKDRMKLLLEKSQFQQIKRQQA